MPEKALNQIIWIADASSNHCGSLEKAYQIIKEASQIGVSIIKFQHWVTSRFINKERFNNLKISHQKEWKEDVYSTYQKYEIPLEWIPKLKNCCDENNIEFMLSEYDLQSIQYTNQFVKRHKIGSGDIDYFRIIKEFIKTEKQLIFGLGACSWKDWENLRSLLCKKGRFISSIYLHCNTNYELNEQNRKYINLNLLDYLGNTTFNYGVSDHLKNNDIIIGAIAKGSSYIERHLKLDEENNSPDNKFSLTPKEYKIMIEKGNDFYNCLGNGIFKVEEDEEESRKVQRRALLVDKMRPNL
jgi:sialic acid synthase SpsE